MNIKDAIKEGFNSWNILTGYIIGAITSIGGTVTLFFTWFDNLIPAPYLLLAKFCIIYIGLLILVILVCNVIIHKKRKKEKNSLILLLDFKQEKQGGEEVKDQYYCSDKQRNIGRVIKWIFIVLSLLFILQGVKIYLSEREKCKEYAEYLGVRIYNFSDAEHDPFAGSIHSYLTSNIEDPKIIIDTVNTSINLSRIQKPDDLAPFLGCYGKGLVVYGHRKENESSFFCKIYIRNISDYITDTIKYAGKIITIQDPNYFNIEFAKQYRVVSHIILAIICYQERKYDQSVELLKKILEDKEGYENKKFIAACYLVIGNCYFRKKDISTAFECYGKGKRFDTENNILQNNYNIIDRSDFNRDRFVWQAVPYPYRWSPTDTVQLRLTREAIEKVLSPYKELWNYGGRALVIKNVDNTWDGAIFSKVGLTKIFYNAPDIETAKSEVWKFLGVRDPISAGYPLYFSKGR